MTINKDRKTIDAPVSTVRQPRFDGREMAMIHKMFRRELGLAGGVVRRVAAGDDRRAQIVAAHVRMVSTTLHHHHSGEDRYVWPLLEIRAAADLSGKLVAVMEQHRDVDAVQAEVDGELPIWSFRATAESRDRLADALDRLAAAAVAHMDYEEAHIVPVMEEHIGLAEWNQIVQAITSGLDPSAAVLILGMSMYEGDPDIIERTIANMPSELRVGMAQNAIHAFEQRAQLIHGTARPPRSTELG